MTQHPGVGAPDHSGPEQGQHPAPTYPPTTWRPGFPAPWPPQVQQPWQPQAPPPAPFQRGPHPTFPHPEPRAYHEMLRTWSYRWWRPAVGILALVAGMLVVLPLLLLPVLVAGVLLEGGEEDFLDAFLRAGTFEELTPSGLLYLNLSLGGLILWTWLLIRVLHQMRPRWLASVAPKLRWGYLFACAGLALVALIASVVVGTLLPESANPEISTEGVDYTTTTLWLALVILFTTPFQAIGEEYAFRGYLMQAVGSLTRRRWAALVVTSTLFAMAHGLQNPPLFFDRFMFGLVAGWLVIRTGGLEAGIAMHVLNNYVAFGLALAFSDINETLTVSEISWWNVPVTLTQSLVYAALAAWVAQRMGLRNRTSPPDGSTADVRQPAHHPQLQP
jgi:uncharacterized protein